MRSYMRTFQTLRDDAYIGGHLDHVKHVGTDRFGNRYFEDWGVDGEVMRHQKQKVGGKGIFQNSYGGCG